MSEPSSSPAGKAGAPQRGVSPARHVVGLIVLLGVVIVGWLEYSAKSGYNAAVGALNTRTQDEDKELMTAQEAESLLGKSPDGPDSDVVDADRTYTRKTYTWHGVIKSYPVIAFYTKGTDPRLHHFETEGAKYVAEPAAKPAIPAPAPEPAAEKGKPAPAPEPAAEKARPAPASEPAAEKGKPAPASEPAAEKGKPAPASEPAAEKAKPGPPSEPTAKKAPE